MRAHTRIEDIADHLRRQILSGRLAPGAQLPTRVQLEREFSASTITVQRALERLAAEEFVRAQRRNGTFVVDRPPHLYRAGLVFPSRPSHSRPWSRFMTSLREIVADEIWAPRKIVSFYGGGGHADSEDFLELSANVRSRRLAGLIYAYEAEDLADTMLFEDAVVRDVPRVFISAEASLEPRVQLDGWSFHTRAMEYLRQRGRQRVAVLFSSEVDPGGDWPARVQAEIARQGLHTCRQWLHGVDKLRPGWTASLVQLLCSGPASERPDALVINDDNIVEYATAGLVAAGVRVPEDLDVVAHCNFPWPTPSAMPLVRLGFDVRQVMRACLDALEAGRLEQTPPGVTEIGAVFESEINGGSGDLPHATRSSHV